jgi:putative DNA-invertase from lambdoid prophage Rac
MDRAKKQGHQIGRPRVTDRPGFNTRYKTILERLTNGDISRRRAAKELGIGYATLKRLIDKQKQAGLKKSQNLDLYIANEE